MGETYNVTQHRENCSKDRRVVSASVQMFPFLAEYGVTIPQFEVTVTDGLVQCKRKKYNTLELERLFDCLSNKYFTTKNSLNFFSIICPLLCPLYHLPCLCLSPTLLHKWRGFLFYSWTCLCLSLKALTDVSLSIQTCHSYQITPSTQVTFYCTWWNESGQICNINL